jgi:hypothetical protein
LAAALPTSPLNSLTHVLTTLRTTHQEILRFRPLDQARPQPQAHAQAQAQFQSQSQSQNQVQHGGTSLGLTIMPTAGPGGVAGASGLRQTLLAEIVEGESGSGGLVAVGKREVLGVDPGMELWRRILG